MVAIHKSASSFVALFCTAVAMVLHVIAMATPHWLDARGVNGTLVYEVGLMRHCEIHPGDTVDAIDCGAMQDVYTILDNTDTGEYIYSVQYVIMYVCMYVCVYVCMYVCTRMLQIATDSIQIWQSFRL
jgi:hypothetical protein